MEETLSRLQLQLESANEELDQQKRVNLALVKRQVCVCVCAHIIFVSVM